MVCSGRRYAADAGMGQPILPSRFSQACRADRGEYRSDYDNLHGGSVWKSRHDGIAWATIERRIRSESAESAKGRNSKREEEQRGEGGTDGRPLDFGPN